MQNNYDRVAWFYDFLGKLVFQNALMESQRSLVHFIHAPARILIVGGGTGRVLEEIAKLCPEGLGITYVEISNEMLKRAKKRDAGKNQVTFVSGAIEDFHTNEQFDVILTAFLFDNFKQERAEKVFTMLHKMLDSKGLWLFADFRIDENAGSKWHAPLLKMMYSFFNIFLQIEAKNLPDITSSFKAAGYRQVFQEFHFKRFIHAIVYEKP